MRRGFAVAAVVLIGVLALTAGHGTGIPPSPAGTPSAAPRDPATPAAATFVRTCADGMDGTLTAHTWRHSLVGGPLAVIWLRPGGALSPGSIGHHLRGFDPAYYLVVVRQGQQVTLSVPASTQGHVAFLYDSPTASPDAPIEVGNTAVTLRACPGTSTDWRDGTQFVGQLLVGRARCVVLNVRDVSSRRMWRLTAPFGSQACPRTLTPLRPRTHPPGPF